MKVLHFISSLNVGGTQTLLKSLISTDYMKDGVEHFLLVENEAMGFFDEDFKALGATILRGPSPKDNIFSYTKFLTKIIKSEKINVVHSHVAAFSGVILCLSYFLKVKKRISHAHSLVKKPSSIYNRTMRCLIKLFSTNMLACSEEAGRSLFNTETDFLVIPNGVSFYSVLAKNKQIDPVERNKLLKVGHVGRFVEEKNHTFLLNIISEIKSPIELHLVGDGELKDIIISKVKDIKREDEVIFHGNKIYPFESVASCDVLIFPSIREGFGISIIEAQVNGIPTLISENIPDEVIFIPELVFKLDLKLGAKAWATKITDIKNKNINIPLASRLSFFSNSNFDINYSAKLLRYEVYED